MADHANTHANEPRDIAPDLVGVKSRVSWSAILAGAIIGLAASLVLTLLLGAIGFTLTDAGLRGGNVAVGVLIAVFVTVIASMFLAGWVASQLTVGENREEAALYGLLTWATVTALSVSLVGMGMKAGYFAVMSGALMAQNERAPSLEESMRQMGYTNEQIERTKATLTPGSVQAAANNPENQEAARKSAMYSAWTALVAIMLSMGACVGGAVTGRGMTFRIFPAVVATRRDNGPRLIIPNA